tara:strand:+ start:184 stop:324 length:141 start_codon:yes stop_codon:yes gene_type:complete
METSISCGLKLSEEKETKYLMESKNSQKFRQLWRRIEIFPKEERVK